MAEILLSSLPLMLDIPFIVSLNEFLGFQNVFGMEKGLWMKRIAVFVFMVHDYAPLLCRELPALDIPGMPCVSAFKDDVKPCQSLHFKVFFINTGKIGSGKHLLFPTLAPHFGHVFVYPDPIIMSLLVYDMTFRNCYRCFSRSLTGHWPLLSLLSTF